MPDDFATAAAVLAASVAASKDEEQIFQTWRKLYDRMKASRPGSDATGSSPLEKDPLGGAES